MYGRLREQQQETNLLFIFTLKHFRPIVTILTIIPSVQLYPCVQLLQDQVYVLADCSFFSQPLLSSGCSHVFAEQMSFFCDVSTKRSP